MSLIDENKLDLYNQMSNFIKFQNKKALFNTKMAESMNYNGQVVDVLGYLEGKDIYNSRYIVRFNDDKIDDNIYTFELDFDYDKKVMSVNDYIRMECKKFDLDEKTPNEKIEEYYSTITGIYDDNMSIKQKKEYLYVYLLEDMIRENEITPEQAKNFLKELSKKEKNKSRGDR